MVFYRRLDFIHRRRLPINDIYQMPLFATLKRLNKQEVTVDIRYDIDNLIAIFMFCAWIEVRESTRVACVRGWAKMAFSKCKTYVER